MGVVPGPLVVFWSLLGAAAGALVAALVARRQFVAARRDYRLHLRRRDSAVERLKKELGDHRKRLERQVDEQRQELSALRLERSTLAGDLAQTRLTLSTLQSNLDTLRISARESEARLTAALDAARQEAATRRATATEELAAAEASAHKLRTELSMRIASLENEHSQLESERSRLENDRSRLEAELAAERRGNAEKQETLRSIVTTLREQYSIACAERDALEREAEEQRARADEVEVALRAARDEYSARLDSEHHESVELITRVWDYVHNYPRLRARPVHGPSAPASVSAPPAPPASPASPSATRPRPADLPPEPEPQPEEYSGSGGTRAQPVTTDREVRQNHPRVAGDACADDDYDIERELAGPAPSPESRPVSSTPLADAPPRAAAHSGEPGSTAATPTTPSPAAEPSPAEPSTPEPSTAPAREPQPKWRPMPPPRSGSTRVRRPVSTVRRENDVLVICDDGSVWSKRATGWTEEPSIPGSEVLPEEPPADDASGGPGKTASGRSGEGEAPAR